MAAAWLIFVGWHGGVGRQSKSSNIVSRHAGYWLDIHAVLQGGGGKCAEQIVESDIERVHLGQNIFRLMACVL